MSHPTLASTIGSEAWDAAIVTYGRLRTIAEALRKASGTSCRSAVASPIAVLRPVAPLTTGLPAPVAEDAPTSTEADDGKSYRIAATERQLFEHPQATHFRYRGLRTAAARARSGRWCAASSTTGRTSCCPTAAPCSTFGFTDLAHALLLAVDQPGQAKGEIFNAADDECLTIRQVVEICATELDHEWELISMPADLARPAWPLLAGPTSHHRLYDTSKLRTRLGYRDVVPAREAVARTARWFADNPLERGGQTEQIIEDPFDYENEDLLIEWWRTAIARPPELAGGSRPATAWPMPARDELPAPRHAQPARAATSDQSTRLLRKAPVSTMIVPAIAHALTVSSRNTTPSTIDTAGSHRSRSTSAAPTRPVSQPAKA